MYMNVFFKNFSFLFRGNKSVCYNSVAPSDLDL